MVSGRSFLCLFLARNTVRRRGLSSPLSSFHLYTSCRYLVTAPRFLRLDAAETVLVHLFGYTGEVQVSITLKSSMARNSVSYSEQTVTLNLANNYQAVTRVQVSAMIYCPQNPSAFIPTHYEFILQYIARLWHGLECPWPRIIGFK